MKIHLSKDALCIPLVLTCMAIAGCSDNSERIRPTYTTLTESVYASVNVQPDSLYQVYGSISGIVDEVLKQEGDIVQAGEIVFSIENDVPALNVENARLAFQLAKENYLGKATLIQPIKDRLSMTKVRLRQDSTDYFRQQRLWQENIGTAKEYDLRKEAYELSRYEVAALINEIQRTEVTLNSQLQQAEIVYRNALSSAREFEIRSKIDGRVYEIFKETGEMVSPQTPLAAIGSAHNFILEMEVDETDIVRLEIGQRVIIRLDAYRDEGQVFEAVISRILPQKDLRTRTFAVYATFTEAPKQLYAGLSGEANIVTAISDQTLVMPRSYLVSENQVLTDQGLKTLEIGRKNMEFVEVLSGIDTATYLLPPE